MKKRMLSLLIALCMALSLMPVTAFADDGTADVSSRDELRAALDDSTVSVINITDDIDMGAESWNGGFIDTNRTLTINGNEHTISNLNVTTAYRQPDGSGVPGNGSSCDYYAGLIANNKGNLTINDLKFDTALIDIDPVTVNKSSTGSSILAVVCANNLGTLVYNNVDVSNAVVKGYNKTGILHGFSQKGASFIANHCSISDCEVVVEADGTDSEAGFAGCIIGYNGYNCSKTNGIKIENFHFTIDPSVVWASEIMTGDDGVTTYARSTNGALYGVTSSTYTTGSAGTTSVQMVAEIDGYQYESLNDAVAAATLDDTITLLDDVTVSSKIAIAEKSITIDLNGHTITGQQTRDDGTYGVRVFNVNNGAELLLTGKGVVTTLDANGEYFPDNDAIIVVDSNPTGDIKGNAKLIIDEDVKVIAPASYGVTIFGCNNENAKPTIVVRGEVTAEASALSGNGTYSVVDIIVEDTAKLTSTESPCIYFPANGNLTINGGSITGVGGIEVKAGTTVVSISGDPYITATGTPSHEANGNGNSSVGYAIAAVENDGYGGNASVTIKNGHYHGPIGVLIDNETERHSMISISGGYFTEDPSEYCVEGKTGVASDDADYPYTVGEKGTTPAEVEAVIVPADVAEGASQAAKDAAAAMDGVHVEQNNNLEAAVKNEANNNDITPNTSIKTDNGIKSVTEVLMELDGNSGIKEKDVVIVYQPYIDVKVADAKTDGADTPKYTELTVEMTPMYRVIATTKAVYENENVDYYTDGDKQNAIIVEEAKELDLADKEYDVTVFLPDDFATDGDKLSVKHEKDDGSVEYYTGTYRETTSTTAFVQFTTKGFSPFTIYAASESAAEVEGVIYPSLEAAVDAVKNNGTIKLLKDVAADEKATVSKTITFNVDPDNHAFDSEKNLVAGNRTTVTSEKLPNGVYSFKFTYTPSSGSGSTSSYYTVTVASTKNGTVSASTKSAAKDEVVTVTVKADNGYGLDKLTVTDANGNELKLTDKGDGKYTFVMPKSKVTVTATFALADENPIFDDIDKDAYYYDAIKWAVANGVTNGMSTTEFVPDGPCTRGQIVTFLWRAAGKPAPTTTNNPFVDVNEKDYYYEAVLWAVENGITNGMSETEFMPELTCTRAHGVTFLYRAMGKAVDAKAEFSDVPADAYYAQAVAWAAANGVTNGVSEELFAPDNACTRVQIVTFLYRANLIK